MARGVYYYFLKLTLLRVGNAKKGCLSSLAHPGATPQGMNMISGSRKKKPAKVLLRGFCGHI